MLSRENAKLSTLSADHRLNLPIVYVTPDHQHWIHRRHSISGGEGHVTRHSVHSW